MFRAQTSKLYIDQLNNEYCSAELYFAYGVPKFGSHVGYLFFLLTYVFYPNPVPAAVRQQQQQPKYMSKKPGRNNVCSPA